MINGFRDTEASEDVEATKRPNIKSLNHTAIPHFKKEIKLEKKEHVNIYLVWKYVVRRQRSKKRKNNE